MPVLAPGLTWIDLKFRGRPDVIATAVASSSAGVVLIDPGPTSCLATLEAGLETMGIRLVDVTHVLLTHVHLDHAGAAGTIVRRNPRVRVLVHELGAPHLIDPTRLVRSATRLYADQMHVLWGEIAAVPTGNVEVVDTRAARLDIAGRRLEVAYTPGHAVHHVSYFDLLSGIAFVGDAAGVRIHGDYVRPPTPPPDIDIEQWIATASRIERWAPTAMFLTHFGPSNAVVPHLRALVENLTSAGEWVRQSLGGAGSDEEKARRYADYVEDELQRHLTEDERRPHHVGAPFEVSWQGLARYWRKKGI